MSEMEGVAVNQLINVAIAEKLAQMRTSKWFVERSAAGDPKAGEQLIRDLRRGGGEKPGKGDVIASASAKRRQDPKLRS